MIKKQYLITCDDDCDCTLTIDHIKNAKALLEEEEWYYEEKDGIITRTFCHNHSDVFICDQCDEKIIVPYDEQPKDWIIEPRFNNFCSPACKSDYEDEAEQERKEMKAVVKMSIKY